MSIIGAAIAGAVALGSAIYGSARAKKAAKKQEESQMAINKQNAQLNFEYGEMAADNAQERGSLVNQMNDINEAGLSPGLIYGGAGAGGTGAQGSGARGQSSEAADWIGAMEVALNAKMVGAETARMAAETSLIKEQREQMKAETEKTKEDTATSQELTPFQKALLKEQGVAQWIENERKEWENETHEEFESKNIRHKDLERTINISKGSNFDERITTEIAEAKSRIEGNKAMTELNTEKKKMLWNELVNATKNADANATQAAAIKLAAEWQTGEFTNWKTWTNEAKEAVKGIADIIAKGRK